MLFRQWNSDASDKVSVLIRDVGRVWSYFPHVCLCNRRSLMMYGVTYKLPNCFLPTKLMWLCMYMHVYMCPGSLQHNNIISIP